MLHPGNAVADCPAWSFFIPLSTALRRQVRGRNSGIAEARPGILQLIAWLCLLMLALGANPALAAVPTLTSTAPNNGPTTGMTSVTIIGTNFTGATSVMFDGTSAISYTVNSDTSITATTPGHAAGTVVVLVYTPGGSAALTHGYTYTAPVPAPTVGPVSVYVSANSSANPITLNISGGAATSVAVASAASHGNATASGTSITYTPNAGFSGSDSFNYTATNASGTSSPATVSITVSRPTITLSPSGLSNGIIGIAYSATLSTSGGTAPYTYTITAGSLPPGISLNTSTGVISGTPSASGTANLTITATDAYSATGSRAYTLVIGAQVPVAGAVSATLAANSSANPITLNISGAAATSVAVASAASHGNATASGTSITYTPNAGFSGSDSFTYTATNASGTSSPATVSITVSRPTITLSPSGLSNGIIGIAYSATLSTSGGTAPYTYAITAGSLLPGMTLSPIGILSGTPSASGTTNLTITATDANGATASQAYTLLVTDETPIAPSQTINSAGPGQPVEIDLTSNATGGPFTAANLLTTVPASVGSASIHEASTDRSNLRAATVRAVGKSYILRFVPNPDANGAVSLSYTLSNTSKTSSPGVISITLSSRSDPSKDAEVQGLLNAQANSSRRFANGQISNFQQRLEALHAGNVSPFSNGLTLSSASLQRQRQRLNDDPTGIEQWLQIKSAKVQAEPSLRARPASSVGEQMPVLGNNQPANEQTSPLAFWTSGTISIGDDAKRSSDNEQRFVTSGLSVGADYRWAPNLTLGVGLGYGHDKTDIGDNGSRSQADSYSVALYGSYRPIESIFLDAVLGYQRLTFDTRRYVTDNAGMVNGNRDGNQTFASLAAGYEYREDQWLLSPYARLDLAHGKLDHYREIGDAIFALRYEEQTVKTTSTSLGLRSEYAKITAFGELTPSLRLEYQHDFQGAGDASMRYADNSGIGTLYHINLDPLSQDRGVLGLGLGLLMESNWNLRMEYQFTIGSGAQQTQSMLFNLGKPF